MREPQLAGGGYGVSNQGPRKEEPPEWSMTFKCFPDTLDPRGPKGKRTLQQGPAGGSSL